MSTREDLEWDDRRDGPERPDYVCFECGAEDDLEWFCTECGDAVPEGRCMNTRECQDAATVEHCCGCGEKAVGRD